VTAKVEGFLVPQGWSLPKKYSKLAVWHGRTARHTALAKYDMVPMYMSTAGYTRFAQGAFVREKALVEKLGLLKAS
jgi:hypothetical protein